MVSWTEEVSVIKTSSHYFEMFVYSGNIIFTPCYIGHSFIEDISMLKYFNNLVPVSI